MNTNERGFKHSELTEKIIGVVYDVYNELGYGFLESVYEAQLLNYLRATPIEVGLLMNFGPTPEFKRLVFDNPRKQIRVNPRQSVANHAST